MEAPTIPPTERTRLRRYPARGEFDRAAIHAILNEGTVCHVGFVADGQPYVIPTSYGRSGDVLYLHGSPLSRMLAALAAGAPVCVTVTLVDALVLARSAFRHSMNYRSVVILGTAREVAEPAARAEALRAIVEHVVPGRWPELREPSEDEIEHTCVLALPIVEASAKIRRGGPVDLESDRSPDVWAGELPLRTVPGAPLPAEDVEPGVPAPASVAAWSRPRAGARS